MTRSGVRIADIFDPEVFEAKLRRLAHGFQKRFGELLKYDMEAEILRYKVFEFSFFSLRDSNKILTCLPRITGKS